MIENFEHWYKILSMIENSNLDKIFWTLDVDLHYNKLITKLVR